MAEGDDEVADLRSRVAALEAELAAVRDAAATAARQANYWRRILESAPEHISIFDRDGRFVYINHIAPDYAGESYIGRNLAEIIPPQYWKEAFATAIRERRRTQYESRDDARRHWFRCSVNPITLDDGETYVVVVSRVVDELKQVEDELRDARALWDSLVANSPDNIMLLEPDSRVISISKLAPGYTRADVVGRLGTEFVEGQYREALQLAIRRVAETRQPQFFEMQDVRAGMWWWVTLVPVRDSQRGDLVLAISQDVTQRRQSQDALRESKTRLRLMLDQVPAIIWTTDETLRVKAASGAGIESVGVSASDWQGRTIGEILNLPEGSAPVAAHRAALNGQSVNFEFPWREWAFHIHVEPLRAPQGEITGTIGLALDITSRVEAEQGLRQARDELERRVAERTAELDRANHMLREDIAKHELFERRLRESEERFRVIADTVPVAIVITRLSDGQIVYVNHRVADLFETPVAELLGKKSTDFYVEPDERTALMDRLRARETVLDLELSLQSPSGKRMLVSGSYQPLDFDGEPCVLTGFIDITRRIEAEQALLAERRLLKRLLDLHERDRQLISYEIHDGIVQDMTAALMFFESSRPPEFDERHPTHDAFHSGLRLLRGSIVEARRIINGLQPPVLEDQGVVAALMALVAEMERDSGLEIELLTDVSFERLAPALEMAIYRIVQEGLNNVWRHSGSTRAKVELVQREEWIDLQVQDWGVGFDPQKVAKRRYGLMGIRERSRLLKGRADVASTPGAGTTVKVELPLIDALMPSGDE